MNEKDILSKGLKAANRIRRYLKLPPVQNLYGGNKGDDKSCPITNTIYDDDLDRDRYIVSTTLKYVSVVDNETGKHKSYRHYGESFVEWFDEDSLGNYPDLYKPGTLTKVD